MGNAISSECIYDKFGTLNDIAPFVEKTLRCHSNGVKTVCFSPDQSILFSAGEDLKAVLSNLPTNTKKEFYGHESTISGSDFSSNGRFLATSSWDETCRIWNVENSGGKPGKDDSTAVLKSHSLSVYCVKFFRHDPLKLASGSYDATVRVWDVEKQKDVLKLESVEGYVESIDILPDDNTIVSGANEKLRIWDIRNGNKCVKVLGEHHIDTVHSVQFDPNTNSIASASRTVKISDFRTFQILQSFEEHTDSVRCVSFHPTGNYLLSGSWDRTIKLYDLAHESKVLYNLKTQDQEVQSDDRNKGRVSSVQFSPDGKFFASSCDDDKNVLLWNCDSEF